MTYKPRLALTLLELLLVVAVVGILLALAVPAVQMARESARRTECSSHLRSIGLALHNYHATSSMFPSTMFASEVRSDGGAVSSKRYSVFVRLLPYLDEGPLFNAINLSMECVWGSDSVHLDPINGTAFRTIVETYLCPSDTPMARFRANANYRFNSGCEPDGYGQGPFQGFSFLSARDFVDGLSFTIGASEKLTGDENESVFHRGKDYWFSGATALVPNLNPDQMHTICAGLNGPLPTHYSKSGYSWATSDYDNTLYNHVASPNSTAADCSAYAWKSAFTNYGSFAARSNHPGGVHTCTMDGSVRFVTNSIDLIAWRALATRSGGEAISTDY